MFAGELWDLREPRDDGDKRARREVEGREVQEDGGGRRRRRVQQAFILQSQRDGSGEESQPEGDPGEQRYILGKVWVVKVVTCDGWRVTGEVWGSNELESNGKMFRLYTEERKSEEQIWKRQEIVETEQVWVRPDLI